MTDALPLLVTHSGSFHCDEAFAYVVLRHALGLHAPGQDHRLVRTRDAATIAQGDYVWDVGLSYDPAAHRYDHHQRGAPAREDGTPFSSAGLVWQHFGQDALRALLRAEGAEDMAPAIAAELDRSLIRRIDEVDNGVAGSREALDLAALVGDCNLTWDTPEEGRQQAEDAAFLQAVALLDGVLRRRVAVLRSRLAADAKVVAAHAASADPRVLELERGMPWKNAVFAHALPVIYAVYPVPNGNWMVDAMPPEPHSFAQRLPLPEEWAGLQEAALAEASGVPDAVFVHVRRFVGAARSRAGAVAMAQKALRMGGLVTA
ncbi:MYG1 family protein [Roseomonas marmotae]|uniref:MYG1 family protein n=1 Tax=Roseomonas marmotae TaxID=2768161 RepID=A0ABS3KEF8_9PROT|nr:MYG1 family protein [Roseomonas marmotae]MBO1075862.1 MYG1 family protein [Roseomonas marmotae]QTI81948.1 MYG1 family protein [Roseomonas marmotae]